MNFTHQYGYALLHRERREIEHCGTVEQNDEEYNAQKYIDVLPSMVEKYNNTFHRSIKLTPSDARNPANYQHIHSALYAKVTTRNSASAKFHIGDRVRITRMVHLRKDLHQAVLTISSVKVTKLPTYTIKYTLGEPVQGTFYEQEQQFECTRSFSYRTRRRRR